MEITLAIPDDIAVSLQNGSRESLSRSLLEMAALEGYKSGQFTRPQIQAMLGFESRFDLDGFLKAHGVFFDYSDEQLAREVETIRQLREQRAA